MKEDKDIGELFKEAFDNFEPEIQVNVWSSVEQELQSRGLQTGSSSGTVGAKGLLGKMGTLPLVVAGSAIAGAALFYAASPDRKPTEILNSQENGSPVETPVAHPDFTPGHQTGPAVFNINTDVAIEQNQFIEKTMAVTKKEQKAPETPAETFVIKTEPKAYTPPASTAEHRAEKWPVSRTDAAAQTHTNVVPHPDQNNFTGTQAHTINKVQTILPPEGMHKPPAIAVEKGKENAPVALIQTNTIGGYAPLTVDFTSVYDGHQVYWDFDDGFTGTNAQVKHVFTESGSYRVGLEVTGKDGRTSADYTMIEVKEGSSFTYDPGNFPNVFSPNGDGYNDRFIVPGIKARNMVSVAISIFNKNTVLVNRSAHLEDGWDGTDRSGQPLPEGTYFYLIVAKGIDGVVYPPVKGSLTLLR